MPRRKREDESDAGTLRALVRDALAERAKTPRSRMRTMRDLADDVGRSPATLETYMVGRRRLGAELVGALADALGLTRAAVEAAAAETWSRASGGKSSDSAE